MPLISTRTIQFINRSLFYFNRTYHPEMIIYKPSTWYGRIGSDLLVCVCVDMRSELRTQNFRSVGRVQSVESALLNRFRENRRCFARLMFYSDLVRFGQRVTAFTTGVALL